MRFRVDVDEVKQTQMPEIFVLGKSRVRSNAFVVVEKLPASKQNQFSLYSIAVFA